MIRVNTIAMLDGSIRTVELGTLEAIELCERVTRTSGRAARNLGAWSVLALANIDAIEAYLLTQSEDEAIALDARENLEWLMYETSNAMYELGYYADWHGGWFYIETIDEGEAE